MDDEGNALVAGYTKSLRLDGHFTSAYASGYSGFLMKFNAQGVHQWTRVLGGGSDERPIALQVDRVRHPALFFVSGAKFPNCSRGPCSEPGIMWSVKSTNLVGPPCR